MPLRKPANKKARNPTGKRKPAGKKRPLPKMSKELREIAVKKGKWQNPWDVFSTIGARYGQNPERGAILCDQFIELYCRSHGKTMARHAKLESELRNIKEKIFAGMRPGAPR